MSAIVNVSGTGSSSSTTLRGFALRDSSGQLWQVSVLITGNLNTSLVSSVSSGYLRFNQLVLVDSAGSYWTITVSTVGSLTTTAGGSYATSIDKFFLTDTNGITWILTVTVGGALETE